MKFDLRVGKGKKEYCTETCYYHVTIYLLRRNTYLEHLEKRKNARLGRHPLSKIQRTVEVQMVKSGLEYQLMEKVEMTE